MPTSCHPVMLCGGVTKYRLTRIPVIGNASSASVASDAGVLASPR